MTNRNYTIFSIIFLFLLSALMMLRQLSSPNYFSCYVTDTYEYASWASQFIAGMKEGVIYPRWLPLNFWGYGSPTFILYPPLAFYMVGFFYAFLDSVVPAMNFVKFFSLFIASAGIFFLLRRFYPRKVALISASFYILLPFNISNIYTGGAFTFSVSLMWFPLILLFIYKYMERERLLHLLYAGACYGGLILTHLVSAYMFSFVIVTFILYMSIADKRPGYLIGIPVIIVTGILISSAYLLPFSYEKQFINYNSIIRVFLFSDLFILPDHTAKLNPNFFWTEYYGEAADHVVLFFALTVLFFFSARKSHDLKIMRNVNTVNKFFLGVSLFSLFLLFGPSSFLWETIPYFKYIGIPARWLCITAVAVVFLSGCGFYVHGAFLATKKKYYSLFFFGVIILVFVTFFSMDYEYMTSGCIFTKQELIPAKPVNWLQEHLLNGVDVGKISREREFRDEVILKGEGKAKIAAWRSAERVVEISAQTPLTLRIRTFNFPGWKAYIDDARSEIKTEGGTMAMLVDIPEGNHTLVLRFEDTPIRYYSKIISLGSLCVIALISLFSGGFLNKKRNAT